MSALYRTSGAEPMWIAKVPDRTAPDSDRKIQDDTIFGVTHGREPDPVEGTDLALLWSECLGLKPANEYIRKSVALISPFISETPGSWKLVCVILKTAVGLMASL